jgi:ribosomal protein S18 acetylase RimI-like enzyme
MSQRVVTIRGADRSDVPGIADVARQTWTATYAGIIPDEVQRQLLESWYSAPALSRAIASPGAFLVATQAGRVVGFAQFVWRPPESAELARIYVLPERQHVGVGTMLLDAGFAVSEAGSGPRQRPRRVGQRHWSCLLSKPGLHGNWEAPSRGRRLLSGSRRMS